MCLALEWGGPSVLRSAGPTLDPWSRRPGDQARGRPTCARLPFLKPPKTIGLVGKHLPSDFGDSNPFGYRAT